MLGYSLAILSLAASTQAATWGYIPGVDGNNRIVLVDSNKILFEIFNQKK